MGVRSPSDSTDGEIQTFIYIYILPQDYSIQSLIILYISCLYVQIEHQDYSVQSLIIS